MPFRILSIDGGGIRGIIPAIILGEFERVAGRPVHELFDLVVGSSTGALLTLGLTVPGTDGRPRYTAEDLLALYLDGGPAIFSRSATYRIRSVNGLANAKYPAANIERVLDRYYGDARLAEVLGDVLVTTYETELREPFLLRSRRARTQHAYDFALRDVARAATAAPTYFPAARVTAGDGKRWSLVDGAVYANNPTMVGIVEAMAVYEARDIVSVSLGTGRQIRPLPYEQIRSWGLLNWARPVISIVFDGVISTVDFQAEQLARITGELDRHTRFDIPLRIANDDIDDVSAANLQALQDRAGDLVADRAEDIARIVALLDRSGPPPVSAPDGP